VGENTYVIGMARVAWQRPIELVVADLAAAMTAASGQSFSAEVTDDGEFEISSPSAFSLTVVPGFALTAGLATSYTAVTSVQSALGKWRVLRSYGVGLPAMGWHRAVTGLSSAVWDGPFRFFDIEIPQPYRDRPSFDFRRVPVVFSRSDGSGLWALDNLTGYIPARPIEESQQFNWLHPNSGEYTVGNTRYVMMEGDHA
jgi:hypothetical protein